MSESGKSGADKSGPMRIVNRYMFRDNPYQRILYSAIGDAFEPVQGTIDDALALLGETGRGILHVHWEEHIVRKAPTAAEADALSDFFIGQLEDYRARGGRIVWTIHNEAPHEGEHLGQFLRIRRALGRLADRILVHNLKSVEALAGQLALDYAKLFYLPHHSYLGVYPGADENLAPPPPRAPDERPNALLFGMIRPYKGIEFFLDAMLEHGDPAIALRVAGKALPGSGYDAALTAAYGGEERVTLDFGHVEDADVIATIRSADCLVLPYRQFLTSAVALLGISTGVPVVGPKGSSLEEVLPPENHGLLFEAGDRRSFAEAVARACALGGEERAALGEALLAQSERLRPERISRVYGQLLQSLVDGE